MKKCEYADHCGKVGMIRQPIISYWPRPPELEPYCNGDEDPSMCSVHRHWDENPQRREEVRKMPRPDSMVIPGVIVAAGGLGLMFSGSLAGIPLLFLGGYPAATGLSRRYTGKNLINWLCTRNYRPASDDVYSRMLDMAEGYEETGASKENFFDCTNITPMTSAISNVDALETEIADSKKVRWQGTDFNIGRMRASYP